jgi:ketosteroid isomerase-like protein
VVSGSADLAYTLGKTQISMSDPEGNVSTRQGKYTVVWRKQNGGWRCVVDMFNFDQPPPTPEEAPTEE